MKNIGHIILFLVIFIGIVLVILTIKKRQIEKKAKLAQQNEEKILEEALLFAKKQKYDACYNECIKYVFNPLTGGIVGRPVYCNAKCTGQLEQLKNKYL